MKQILMNEKLTFRVVAIISVVVLGMVMLLSQKVLPRPETPPEFTKYLPGLNALVNGTCFILLLISFYFIKKKRIDIHKKINLLTFLLSAVFIVSYFLYHYLAEETKYPVDHPLRGVYLFILASHIILAAIVMPLVLLSFYYGLKMDVRKHRKLTRFSFPIWLYVTLTGVIVYLMISPYYSFNQ
ncbi:MAG TPA: DUF420 domain-containing protein [Bacteroidia bacterium]|nr:DUF420 domain-containing protein [Bacteroidia bacterium]HNC34230.1 DUF420 domain-containing protein [Bacteroidia bacterium]